MFSYKNLFSGGSYGEVGAIHKSTRNLFVYNEQTQIIFQSSLLIHVIMNCTGLFLDL